MSNQQKSHTTPKIRIIVGLGNPGRDYENAHHNAGRLALEYLAEKSADGAPVFKKAGELFDFCKSNGLILVRPRVFMNESGKAAAQTLKYFKIKPEEMLVAQDDSDIPLGKFKLSSGRSSAGHKGIESIIRALGTNRFWRLRIGIRDPKNKTKAEKFVLKKIGKADRKILEEVFEKITDAMQIYLPDFA